MAKKPQSRPRGFALLSPKRMQEISSMGGKAAHRQGAAHQWTVEEARAAGKKGRGRPRTPPPDSGGAA
jgi:general stress protein YciG